PRLQLLPRASLTEETPPLRVHLLGGFTISFGVRSLDSAAWRLRKAQSLVKLLLLAPGHRLHRERVLELLWPEQRLEAAANNLHYTMPVARGTLAQLWDPEPSWLLATPDLRPSPRTGGGMRLSLRQQIVALDAAVPLWVDTEAFEAAAATAQRSTDPLLYEA